MLEIEAEVRALVADGVIDVTLLGQIVNAYGRKSGGDASLARLLRRLDAIEGAPAAALHHLVPDVLDRRGTARVARLWQGRLDLHLPVQAGANSCLRRMARGYTADGYLRIVDELRAAVPRVELATDVIVGFSGETDAEFAATVELMRRVEFVQAFIFKYWSGRGRPPRTCNPTTCRRR